MSLGFSIASGPEFGGLSVEFSGGGSLIKRPAIAPVAEPVILATGAAAKGISLICGTRVEPPRKAEPARVEYVCSIMALESSRSSRVWA